jgi:hypothetical protein
MHVEELKIWKETAVVYLKALTRIRTAKIQTLFVRPVTNTLCSDLYKWMATSFQYEYMRKLAAIRLYLFYEIWRMDKNSLEDCAQRMNTSIVFTDLYLVSVMKSQGQSLRKGAVKVQSKAGLGERFMRCLFREHPLPVDPIQIFHSVDGFQ